MEIALLIAMVLMGIMNIVCFVTGAKVGQMVSKGKEIEMPTINPVEIARQNASRRAAEKAQNRFDVIQENINNYDGTGAGQKDVPR